MIRTSGFNNKEGLDAASETIGDALADAWEYGSKQVETHLDKNPLSLMWDPHAERLHFMADPTVYVPDATSGGGIEMALYTLGVADSQGVEKLLNARLEEVGSGGLKPYCEYLVSGWRQSTFAERLVTELEKRFPGELTSEIEPVRAAAVLRDIQKWPQDEMSASEGTYRLRSGSDATRSSLTFVTTTPQGDHSLETYSTRGPEEEHSGELSKYHHCDGATKVLNKFFQEPITFTMEPSLIQPTEHDETPPLIAGGSLRKLRSIYSVSKKDLLAPVQEI